jgi:hypothetical protein
MTINTRLRSVQKSLTGRRMALFWLKLSQQRGGYFEYWNNAELQAWPSETEEGGLLYYLALDVNNSVIVAADIWRQIASWAALLGISIIDSMGASKTGNNLSERFREKLCRLLADVLAHEEAVDLISQGYFEGNEVLFADARECLTVSFESARELIVGYNWFAAHKFPSTFLTLHEQHSPAGINRRRRDFVQPLHYGWGKIAEKVLLPHGARHAVVEDIETVRRLHGWFLVYLANTRAPRALLSQ